MPKNLSMSRKTMRIKRQPRQGSWTNNDFNLTQIRRELKGRSNSDILQREVIKGLTEKTIDDKIKIVINRIRKERNRRNKLNGVSYRPDSWEESERQRKILIKDTVLAKLEIALNILQEQLKKIEKRADNRAIIKNATESVEIVRLNENKLVPAKKPEFTPGKEIVPTGTILKKVATGRTIRAKFKYDNRLAEKAIKAEKAETERKERIRKQAVLREYEEFSKFKPSKFEIIKKKQPKHIQDEIDRVFGLNDEEKHLTSEDMENMID